MGKPYTGGCACNAIRYECSGEPMFSWICHCRDCQRATGGGGMVNVVFTDPQVTYTADEPTFHVSTGASGKKTRRGFCPKCGSPITARADIFPQVHAVVAASLDEPERINLIANINTASAQPWDHMSPSIPRIEATPTEQELAELIELNQKS